MPLDPAISGLQLISFTGADDRTDIARLNECQQEFPLIEWAILTYPQETGQLLYPGRDWICRFLDSRPSRRALHVCGADVHGFIHREPELWDLAQRFDRVQVNFFQARDPIDLAALDATSRAFGKPVIVPWNPRNREAVEQLTAPNIQILFDRSGGRGVTPDQWPAALPGRFCTYAGGLGPDNIVRELPRIRGAAGAAGFGIDMQSHIRDSSNRFCFSRIRTVAAYCMGQVGMSPDVPVKTPAFSPL